MNRILSTRMQLILAWVLLIGSIIGWPASALTVARDEPQFILGLSWLAIVVNSLNTIITAAINAEVSS